MSGIRTCWRCGRRIRHKTVMFCSYCEKIKTPENRYKEIGHGKGETMERCEESGCKSPVCWRYCSSHYQEIFAKLAKAGPAARNAERQRLRRKLKKLFHVSNYSIVNYLLAQLGDRKQSKIWARKARFLKWRQAMREFDRKYSWR